MISKEVYIDLNVTLSYKSTLILQSVSVIGNFLADSAEPVQMKKEGDRWQSEFDLPPGEHLYKFLLNQELPIFDPSNNLFEQDSEGELWSLIIIDDDWQRLLSYERYHMNLFSYQLSLGEDRKRIRGYCEVTPLQIGVTIGCNEITGVHVITAAWYSPNETLFEYSENIVCAEGDESVYARFWIEHKRAYTQFPSGQWKLKLFVNGVLVIEDSFSVISDGILYSQGKD